ncbi:hypothetical protein DL771_005014 [Monosporascus sp. 5C6A]|nr:hypothetical protein DL771_005014 [Monosporascus sp. 5C6A]
MASRTPSSLSSPDRKDAEVERQSRLSTESAPAPQLSGNTGRAGLPFSMTHAGVGRIPVRRKRGRGHRPGPLRALGGFWSAPRCTRPTSRGRRTRSRTSRSSRGSARGFPLGSVAVILPYEFLFTSFDMKRLYIAGVTLSQMGSAVCAAAPGMNVLVVGRMVAGAGGTGIYLGGLNYFSELTTREERGTYHSGTGFVWEVGATLGPLVGGDFAVSLATWRWGFWINLVIGGITAPIMLLYLRSIQLEGKSIGNRLANLDFVGFVLSAGVLVAFCDGASTSGWPMLLCLYHPVRPVIPESPPEVSDTGAPVQFVQNAAVGNLRQGLAGRGLSEAALQPALKARGNFSYQLCVKASTSHDTVEGSSADYSIIDFYHQHLRLIPPFSQAEGSVPEGVLLQHAILSVTNEYTNAAIVGNN